MKTQSRFEIVVIAGFCLSVGLNAWAHPRSNLSGKNSLQKGTAMPAHATGTFEVQLTPQPPDGKFEDASLGRMTIDKQIHGDLEATSKGTMLTAGTEVAPPATLPSSVSPARCTAAPELSSSSTPAP
jgi:hypothetical protein